MITNVPITVGYTKSDRYRRDINGILLLDKPVGITSNRALQQVKNLLKAKKAGHTGSLDPLASGVLPICFGKATKLSRFLLAADKSYLVTAKFGITTTTGDADGEIITTSNDVPLLHAEMLVQMFGTFLGNIQQVPPMFSALKRNGIPLYKLARQGKSIEIMPREVKISALKLMNFTSDSVTFVVECSKGTYVRSLVVDMGKYLGCGAHVTELRRIKAGAYELEQTITLDGLQQILAEEKFYDNMLLPLSSVVQDWAHVVLDTNEAEIFVHGKQLAIPSILEFVAHRNVSVSNQQQFHALEYAKSEEYGWPVWVVLVRRSKDLPHTAGSAAYSIMPILGIAEISAEGKILDRVLW